MISSGVSVPYSDEYRELRSNPTTLETLASVTDGELVTWKTTADGRIDLDRTVQSIDHFRRDRLINPRSFGALWPMLLWLAACLFLGDVAVRRIALDLDWMKMAIVTEWNKLRGQEAATSSDYMDKLRSRKAEVDEQLDRSRAAPRPEVSSMLLPTPETTGPIGEPLLEGAEATERAAAARAAEKARPTLASAPRNLPSKATPTAS